MIRPWVCIYCRALAVNIPEGWMRLSSRGEGRFKDCVCKRCRGDDA